jgi:hypothetical protein
VLSAELVAFVHGGVAVSIATRDTQGRPSVTRGWGPLVADDGLTNALCVEAAPGSAIRSNLEDNGAIAIGFCPPTTARALQVKGTAVDVGAPGPAQLERAQQHFEAFAADAATIGFPPEQARRIFSPADLVAATVPIEQVFEQTPGRSAGRRL